MMSVERFQTSSLNAFLLRMLVFTFAIKVLAQVTIILVPRAVLFRLYLFFIELERVFLQD